MPAAIDRPRVRSLLFGFLAVAAVVLVLPGLPWIQTAELKWLDQQFRWLRGNWPLSARHSIIVIGIDEDTPRVMGVPLALMHRQLGALLEGLAAVRPVAVGLDVTLPEASFDSVQPGLDAALTRGLLRLRQVAPVVIGATVGPDGSARPIHPPFVAAAGAAGKGYVLLPADRDRVLRRFDERLGEGGEILPSLAGQLARRLGVQPAPGVVDFSVDGRFEFVTFQQALAWKVQGDTAALQRAFAGKIALIGPVLKFEDRHPVPAAIVPWEPDSTLVPGVVLHAQHLAALLRDRIIEAAPPAALFLPIAAVACLWWLRPRAFTYVIAGTVLVALTLTGMEGLRSGWHIPTFAIGLAAVLAVASRTLYEAWFAAVERRRLSDAFGGVVSPAVLERILSGQIRTRRTGKRRNICIMFSDLRGFTTLSESMAPEAVTALLNRYFDAMTRVIHANGGTLDKFIGDGIMAFFGAPEKRSCACDDAVAAGRAMLEALATLNSELEKEGALPLYIGIGLNYGPAVIGFVGASDRHEYTAIGDTVNTASRIEGLTKETGYPLLVSQSVQARLTNKEGFVPLGEKAIKGHAPVEVFGWRSGVVT